MTDKKSQLQRLAGAIVALLVTGWLAAVANGGPLIDDQALYRLERTGAWDGR